MKIICPGLPLWNFGLWVKVMRITLLRRRQISLKLTEYNGGIDAQLCSVLWQSVDPKILLHLRVYKTCFKFWNQAKGLYTNDIQRLYKVASSIVNVRKQDMDLSTYIGQIAFLKEEFLTVMPLTTDVGDQRTQIDKFFMVLTLIGLHPDLETVHDQILGSSSIPSLDDVFAHLLRIFSTQTLSSDNISDSSVLVSQTNSRGGCSGNRGRGQRPHCTYCNKLGHTHDRCYQLHGRPPRTAHVAQSSDPQPPQPPSFSTSQGISLTDNSGASDHIYGNKDLFSSITTTSALPTITLVNGSQTVAKGIGLAHPLPSLPLTSVLYTPECSFNLISISKITRTLNCSITFSDKFVTLQDRSTGKTIGIGRESQGLYYLTSPSTPAVCISTDTPLLIHSRLGHPSLSKFQKMDKLSAKATKCIFLGYSRLQKGYRCYSFETHCYFLSADVIFFEDSPFFSTSESLPVSEVLPFPIISPPDTVSSHPLQVYHRRHRVAVPPSFAEVPADSLPLPSASPASTLPPSTDLPIALQKRNRSTRNPHLIYNFLSYHRLSSPYFTFVSTISSVSLSKSTPEALSHPGWRWAMVDEMAALYSNGTWDLVVLPSGKSTFGCRWVYTVKVGPDSQVDRLKARLVAKGYTQVYGSDYGDTFSPVTKIALVRLLLSMAAMRSWPLYQLRRSLYGLKQSPRAWFSRFSSVVQEFGMFRSTADHSVFYYHNSSRQCIYLAVYVDDIVITGSDQNGIEIAQSSSGVVLSQRKYALDILEETGMLGCKPVDTPMDPNVKLIPGQGEPLGDPGRYRRLVGKLNYLTITRPDISFPVNVVSQFLQSPCDSHWDAVIRILRYIKSTPGQGVLYENRGHTQVVGYTDANWVDSPTDRCSISGYCVFIGGNLISRKSKKQDVVARSSAEAEYRAMALATCELIWLKHLLRELRFEKDEQMKLICDNQAALHIASNPVFHERTKHIEVDCHFIREKIASGCVATSFVNSNDQLANIFTKSLRGPRIKYICNKLGAYNIYALA
ncbi:Retrovirus-related Pol polyprotein from transposon RE2 [Vitis vinifera]|uniref:Retrovirus-related Pol polyprotein from transposon RE2 n=1 Tax=Vitis vinifera TaxID=29760 RepID=A0A438K5Y9_VITVI|nr:Retrovirus-related Pol polyprotein from transposon RE2 [Vitis vinifera]